MTGGGGPDHLRRSRRNFFAADALERVAERRTDADWIATRLAAAGTRVVPLWRLRNLVARGEPWRAVLPAPADLGGLFDARAALYLGERNGSAYFALELPDDAPERLGDLGADADFLELRDSGHRLDEWSGALLAYARALVAWHRRHRFCAACGAPTSIAEGGHQRVCTEATCASRHFPRTDPAVIVLVTHGADGADQRCLLGHQRGWAAGIYSTVAGFVEPGETLEQAVVREVAEETGVRVAEVSYHSSQPWPFPSSIMVGFTARATTTELTLVDRELADARWMTRAELARDLAAGRVRVPRTVSIAYRLIEDWFDRGGEGALCVHVSAAGGPGRATS